MLVSSSLEMCHALKWAHRLWLPLMGGRAGEGGRGALPLLLSAGASSSDELEDEESESESELDESEPDESESDELSEEDESSARHHTAVYSAHVPLSADVHSPKPVL